MSVATVGKLRSGRLKVLRSSGRMRYLRLGAVMLGADCVKVLSRSGVTSTGLAWCSTHLVLTTFPFY